MAGPTHSGCRRRPDPSRPPLVVVAARDLASVGAALISLVHLIGGAIPHSVTDVFPFAFAAVGSLTLLRQNPHIRFLWILVAGLLAQCPGIDSIRSRTQWGPRMLLSVYPILAVLA